MDLILILLMILLFIVIYMNYNKIMNNDINDDTNKENKKKVKWCEKNIIMGHHLNPEIDYFDQYNNGLDNLPLSNKNINSNVTKYLDKMKNSYSSTISNTYPKKAFLPEDPDYINKIDAHTIINDYDANDRVLDYKQSLLEEDDDDEEGEEGEEGEDREDMYNGEDIGNVYDNLVDNFRVKWGKINRLDGNNKNDLYILDNKPSDIGYTSFATY
jgi:hypothetical protein